MANNSTPQRTIRVDEETWQRWQDAAGRSPRVADVSGLIRAAVEAYIDPHGETASLRKSIGTMSIALMDIRVRVDDTLTEAIARPVAELGARKRKHA